MKRRCFCLLFAVVLFAAAAAASTPEQEILAVMNAQEAAWNRGDLPGYMDGYWKSPQLTFYSGGKLSQGWQDTLDHYQARYQAEGREMGKLEFSDVHVYLLAGDAAWVGGHWRLMMSQGDNPQGLFTLVFRKFPEGWRIVHDHTSSE